MGRSRKTPQQGPQARAPWQHRDPRPSKAPAVFASAERRLRAAIAHGAPPAQQIAAAERVRQAKLGLIKALAHVADRPTAVDDPELALERARLEDEAARWRALSLAQILAAYGARPQLFAVP